VAAASAEPRRDGYPLRLTLPLEGGRFAIRYVAAGETAPAASRGIAVDPPSASVSPTGPVTAGSLFEVAVSGPAARFDDVVVARAGMPASEHLTAARVRPRRDRLRLRAPSEPGEYELRYVAGGGKAIFARQPIRIE